MNIRLRSTGEVVSEQGFRALHPNTSMPQQLTEDIINSFGGDVVFEGPQAQPTRYQIAYQDGVEQKGMKWYTKWTVVEMTDEAKAAKDAEQAKSVREQRNKLLAETDWTQLVDSTVEKEIWAVYRQSLRDVTAQAGFPWDIVWPIDPNGSAKP